MSRFVALMLFAAVVSARAQTTLNSLATTNITSLYGALDFSDIAGVGIWTNTAEETGIVNGDVKGNIDFNPDSGLVQIYNGSFAWNQSSNNWGGYSYRLFGNITNNPQRLETMNVFGEGTNFDLDLAIFATGYATSLTAEFFTGYSVAVGSHGSVERSSDWLPFTNITGVASPYIADRGDLQIACNPAGGGNMQVDLMQMGSFANPEQNAQTWTFVRDGAVLGPAFYNRWYAVYNLGSNTTSTLSVCTADHQSFTNFGTTNIFIPNQTKAVFTTFGTNVVVAFESLSANLTLAGGITAGGQLSLDSGNITSDGAGDVTVKTLNATSALQVQGSNVYTLLPGASVTFTTNGNALTITSSSGSGGIPTSGGSGTNTFLLTPTITNATVAGQTILTKTNGYVRVNGDEVWWKTNITTTSSSAVTYWTNNYFASGNTNGTLYCEAFITAGCPTNAALTNTFIGHADFCFYDAAGGSNPTPTGAKDALTQTGSAGTFTYNTVAGGVQLNFSPANANTLNWVCLVKVHATPVPATWPPSPGP